MCRDYQLRQSKAEQIKDLRLKLARELDKTEALGLIILKHILNVPE